MESYPQVLVNVRTDEKVAQPATECAAVIADVERSLAGEGRVLVRSSGTEPLVRVMVEARTLEIAQRSARTIADDVIARFGGAMEGSH